MSGQSNLDYDPALAQLFASSVGPVQIAERTTPSDITLYAQNQAYHGKGDGDAYIRNSILAAESPQVNDSTQEERKPRKRKRNTGNEDDAETRYMRRLVFQEANGKEPQDTIENGPKSLCANSDGKPQNAGVISPVANAGENEDPDEEIDEPPRHETTALNRKDTDIEKASQTVFLANVSTSTITSKSAKKTLMSHLTSFLPTLPQSNVQHAIESFRFRSTAFSDSGMPRKAAFIKKELMETTAKSTNAYAVYTTRLAAREAVKRLNGTMILDRHLRVDNVAHPAKQDHRRSVFVGNLSFVDDVTNMDAAKSVESQSKPRRGKEPADTEEGLWRQFGKAGRVESVRVVRDKTTRVGKGFAYVQFSDANAVEKALLLDGKKFPPMLPRILRVTRAKSITKAKLRDDRFKSSDVKPGSYGIPKKGTQHLSAHSKFMGGRAKKLFGRAGAAQHIERRTRVKKARRSTKSSLKRAETFKKKAKQK